MENPMPIVCTLTEADLRDRRKAWLKVGNYLTTSKEIPGGLAFGFDAVPGVYDSLRALVRLEAECCAWMTFCLDNAPGRLTMTVTAVGRNGELGVRQAFGPMRRPVVNPRGGQPAR